MADVPPHFLTEEWKTSYRRQAATPHGAVRCAERDFWLEGAYIFPAEKRQSVVIRQMLESRKALAQNDRHFAWNQKTCSYSESELYNIIGALQEIEKKAAHERNVAQTAE